MGLNDIELETFLQRYNTEDILSGIIEMQMCGGEKIIDERIPAAEYLATNAIRFNVSTSTNKFMWRDYLQLEEFASKIYGDDISALFSEALTMTEATDEEKQEFLKAQHMKLKNMAFRGDGYIYQLLSMAELLYKPFDKEFKEKMGFTFTSCEEVLIYIFKSYIFKGMNAHNKKYKITYMLKTIIKLLSGKSELMLPSIKEGYIFRVYKSELFDKFGQSVVESILKYLSIVPGNPELSASEISEFKILTSKPLVNFGEYVYLPLLESTLMNLTKLFHYTFIADTIFDKHTVGKYTKNRGDVVEKLTVEYISRLVAKDCIHRSIEYKGEDGESDVIIQFGQSTLFCECKSKILTLNTLMGNIESIQRDVYQAIGAAYLQAVRSIKRVQTNQIFIEKFGEKKREIKLSNTSLKFIICVTAENFGIIPSEIYNYVEMDKEITIVPYVVNVYDLDIVTQECKSFYEFINYLQFRQENYEVFSSIDELDILGFFKLNGGGKYNIDADELVITNYTEIFDNKYKKNNERKFAEFS